MNCARSSTGWQTPAEWPRLSSNPHLWRAALDLNEDHLTAVAGYLAPDERTRAEHLRFERDRRRCQAARGILRVLLGHYTNQPPEAIRFDYGPQGKPSLAGRPELCFNVAHSAGLGLFAFAWNHPIGVDLEYERPMPDLDSMVGSFFSAAEQAAFQAIQPDQRIRAFFRCWTRKEAYIKALGGGLSVDLKRFDMTLDPGRPAMLLADRESPDAVANWNVYDVCPGDQFAGAVVVNGDVRELWTLQFRQPVLRL